MDVTAYKKTEYISTKNMMFTGFPVKHKITISKTFI